MPEKTVPQSIKGKAFEYACLMSMAGLLEKKGVDYILKKYKDYFRAKAAFECIGTEQQEKCMLAADTGNVLIFELEPRLEFAETDNPLELKLNPIVSIRDKNEDVRDIICIRKDINWDIGISCKHNYETLKHLRLTNPPKPHIANKNHPAPKEKISETVADFGSNWIGYPCSQGYFDKMAAIMEMISSKEGQPWVSAFDDLHGDVYAPVLRLFKEELENICAAHSDAPERLLSFLFGNKDLYRVVPLEKTAQTKIMAFNMYGTLNALVQGHPSIEGIGQTPLPTKLMEVRFKENRTGEISRTTLELIMDSGWTISMRLHNVNSLVKTTGLKFDVQLDGNPVRIYQKQRSWYED